MSTNVALHVRHNSFSDGIITKTRLPGRVPMNWRLKALVQCAMAHMPWGERLNHLAQLANGSFTPSAMYLHLLTQARYLRAVNDRFALRGTTVVEIGPGWCGIGTLMLYLFGAERIYAIDHQPHLRSVLMHRLIDRIRTGLDALAEASGIPLNELQTRIDALPQGAALPDLLSAMRTVYLAPGDASATGLADRSVDMLYSYGVLEHIPLESLEAISRESARILKSTGRACHNIGLHDHFHNAGLGNGVNFLRYPPWLWNLVCANAILYHNRLRLPHYMEMFQRHRLTPLWMRTELTDGNIKALRALKVHKAFAGLSETDLATSHLFIDLAPP